MARLRATLVALLVLVLQIAGAFETAAADPVDVALQAPSIDLTAVMDTISEATPEASVRTATEDGGEAIPSPIKGFGAGPQWNWVVVSFVNPSDLGDPVVLTVPHQGFSGSRIFWPAVPGSRVVAVSPIGGEAPEQLPSLNEDAFRFTVAQDQLLTFAIELNRPGAGDIRLWKADDYMAANNANTFYRGAILGVAMLLALVMMALYSVRSNPAFPAGALFAAFATLRLALEEGYLPALRALLLDTKFDGTVLTAVAESLMLPALIACLIAFPELRKRMPLAGNLLAGVAGLTLVLPVYAIFQPLIAMGLARAGFVLVVVAGFALVALLWREGHPRAQATLPTWAMLVLWTFLCAIAAIAGQALPLLRPAIGLGLVLVLLTMAFTLAQFAFSHGFLSRRFFEESGRRALALAGAQEYVWDWHAKNDELFVGEELERAMGLRPHYFAETGLAGFLDLLHPLDRTAYDAAVRSAERMGKGSFAQEFRLKHADGGWRWFLLKARAMAGADARAQRCIGTLSDISASKRSEERLLKDAVYDRITGLPNRALLVDRLERVLSAITQGGERELHLLLIDLDRFKSLNDGLGHETGDGLLNITGRRLSVLAGPDDTVARMPGDQFGLLLVGARDRDIVRFIERVRTEIARPVEASPKEIFLSASIGVASYSGRGETAEDLLKNAALALYEAKKRGKGSIEIFNERMRDDRGELVTRESDLRRAIERGEIEVYYQPIARIADMDLAGFEALARWRHREFGILGPESFIPLAEQMGLIDEIGRFVLNEAGRQLGIWQRAFRPSDPLFVSVNVSSLQLTSGELPGDIRALIAREGLMRGTLKIEVTESAVMESPEVAARMLDQLALLGVGLACDDFGTGYSSLSNLRKLPFDTLKIDKSFVEPEAAGQRGQVILAATVELAHDLGLTVIAEGIENQERIDALGAMGCDYGQGFFIGPPLTSKQVVEALSGLPYASGPGKTVIAALWERTAGVSPPPGTPQQMVFREPTRVIAAPPPRFSRPAASLAAVLPPVPKVTPPPESKEMPPEPGQAKLAPRIQPAPESGPMTLAEVDTLPPLPRLATPEALPMPPLPSLLHDDDEPPREYEEPDVLPPLPRFAREPDELKPKRKGKKRGRKPKRRPPGEE